MRPQPGTIGGNRFRFIAAVVAIGFTAGGVAGCGDDGSAKSAAGGSGKGTYINGSSQEEFCSVLEDLKAGLDADIHADDEDVLTAIHTINDIEPLAPVETTADWSDLRLVMRAVVEANGSDKVGSISRAEAGAVYAELAGRVSDSVADICGFPLS